MNKIKIQYHKTNIGEFIIGDFENEICILDYRYRKMRKAVDQRILVGLNAEFIEEDSEAIQKAKTQIDEFLASERTEFNINFKLVGSEFQKSVWNALLEIPFGKVNSYLELSKKIGNVKAIRAVATANGANALAILVPCHRVIGSDGSLVGYAGGLKAKQQLLELESKNLFTSQGVNI